MEVMTARPWFEVTNEVLEDELRLGKRELLHVSVRSVSLWFLPHSTSGLAGSSLHLSTKKDPALGPASVVCSQFGKLTKHSWFLQTQHLDLLTK